MVRATVSWWVGEEGGGATHCMGSGVRFLRHERRDSKRLRHGRKKAEHTLRTTRVDFASRVVVGCLGRARRRAVARTALWSFARAEYVPTKL